MTYQVANPLLASYYRFVLAKECGLEVQFEPSNPQHCADLLLRALPYAFFAEVVCSSLSRKLLPHEVQYNQCFQAIWKKLNYRALEFHSSCTGEGKPDCAAQIEKETFVLEGVTHARGQEQINQHLQRFNNMVNYKNAKHQGLYIIGNDSDKMLKTLKNTKAGKVQLIGLVPNIAHTAYTVHVKSEGIEGITPATWTATLWQEGWCSKTMANLSSTACSRSRASTCLQKLRPAPCTCFAPPCFVGLPAFCPFFEGMCQFFQSVHGCQLQEPKVSLRRQRWSGCES